ncbi:hypothetical protein H0H93_016888, partial [Arthromyces matolae]
MRYSGSSSNLEDAAGPGPGANMKTVTLDPAADDDDPNTGFERDIDMIGKEGARAGVDIEVVNLEGTGGTGGIPLGSKEAEMEDGVMGPEMDAEDEEWVKDGVEDALSILELEEVEVEVDADEGVEDDGDE